MTSLAWMQLAACQGVATETMFPSQGEDVRPGKAICATCPVVAPCLDYAVRTGQHYGIWGERSERQRVGLRAKHLADQGIELHANGKRVAIHGTRARYQGGCHCGDCRTANRDYYRKARA
jgi:hypothetical protein